MMQQTSIDSFRYIRVISCFAIVVLHLLFASNVYFEQAISNGQVFVTKTIEHMLMWPVPCFIMVTGALLLDPKRNITIRKVFGKYLRRILLALVVFTLIFQILDYFAGETGTILLGWMEDLFMSRGWAHMWYFYALTGLYLMLPFYRMIVLQASDKLLYYLIGLLALFIAVVPMTGLLGFEVGFYIPTSVIFPIYLFIGYLVHKNDYSMKLGLALAVIPSIVIIVLCVYEYVVHAERHPEGIDMMYEYKSILIVTQSTGVFMLMTKIKAKAGALIRSLDDCSFGIYIIHFAGIKALMKWYGYNPYVSPVMFAVIAVELFLVSYLLVWSFKTAIRHIRGN